MQLPELAGDSIEAQYSLSGPETWPYETKYLIKPLIFAVTAFGYHATVTFLHTLRLYSQCYDNTSKP